MRSARWLSALILSFSFMSGIVLAQSPRTLSDLSPKAGAKFHAALRAQSRSVQVPAAWPQIAKLTTTQFAEYFAGSVAIDGDTLAVGAPYSFPGAVFVFTKPASGWRNMNQVAVLTASDGQTGLGCAVAISGDTIVAGATTPEYDGCALGGPNAGGVFVFVKPPGGWTNMTETARLIATDPRAGENNLGWSVGISGNTVVAGAPGTSSGGQGSVYVFVEPASGWHNMSQTAKLTATDTLPGALLGYGVAVAGNTISATALGGSKAYVYVEPPTGWENATQTAELTASNGLPGDAFGFAAAASGNTIVVGAPYASAGAGAAYIFVAPPNGWMNMTETAELTAAGGHVGYSVAIEPQGLVAGAAYYTNGINDREGAAFVFLKPKSGWKSTSNYQALLTGSDARIVTFFGTSVGISGDKIVAGAPWAVLGSGRQGAAYLYQYVP